MKEKYFFVLRPSANNDEIDQAAKLVTIVLPVGDQAITEETVITAGEI